MTAVPRTHTRGSHYQTTLSSQYPQLTGKVKKKKIENLKQNLITEFLYTQKRKMRPQPQAVRSGSPVRQARKAVHQWRINQPQQQAQEQVRMIQTGLAQPAFP